MGREAVTVLGGGVLGLTSAYLLGQKNKYDVTIIAKYLPGDLNIEYTSPWAGANWRSVCAEDDYTMQAYEQSAYKWFFELAMTHPELVNRCKGYDIFDPREPDRNDMRAIPTQVWFSRLVTDFKVSDKASLPTGAEFGIEFATVTINAPAYIAWLRDECQKMGVQFERREVSDISEIPGTLINCTGLGSRFLKGVEDLNVYPTRGQTVLVRNVTNLEDTYSRVGQDHLSYLIPRPGGGGLIIGGCQQPNNWSYEPDYKLADQMLKWAIELYPGVFPADHKFEIIRHNVGLRPSRIGGPRVEAESRNGRLVVHGYGIGGWGYQASMGLAEKVVELLEQGLVAEKAKL